MDRKEAVNILIANAICNDATHFNGCFKCPFFRHGEDDCFNTMNNGSVFDAVKLLQD